MCDLVAKVIEWTGAVRWERFGDPSQTCIAPQGSWLLRLNDGCAGWATGRNGLFTGLELSRHEERRRRDRDG